MLRELFKEIRSQESPLLGGYNSQNPPASNGSAICGRSSPTKQLCEALKNIPYIKEEEAVSVRIKQLGPAQLA